MNRYDKTGQVHLQSKIIRYKKVSANHGDIIPIEDVNETAIPLTQTYI